jgi:hypothetical protein
MKVMIRDCYSDCGLMIPDLPLPEEVINALGMIYSYWEKDEAVDLPNPPLFVYEGESRGHGPSSPGLVSLITKARRNPSYQADKNGVELGPRREVTARISFGYDRPFEDRNEFFTWDSSVFNRFHIGVIGTKEFLVKNHYERCPKNNVGTLSSLGYEADKITFSLRWMNNVFDNWNDGEHIYHKDRTTRALFQTPSGGGMAMEEEAVLEAIKRIGTGDSLIEHLEEPIADTCRRGEPYFPKRGVFGYGKVLDILTPFGNVSKDDTIYFSKMSIAGGVKYLFENVLPAVDAFVNA